MATGVGEQLPNRILRAFADLAPEARPVPTTRVPYASFCWLPASATEVIVATSPTPHALVPDDAQELLKRARVHEENLLRVGWLWIAGPVPDGQKGRVLFPLVSVPVRPADTAGIIDSLVGRAEVRPVGDAELAPQIDEATERAALEEAIETGGGALYDERAQVDPGLLARLTRLLAWARRAAAAAGCPTNLVAPPDDTSSDPALRPDLAVLAGAALYLAEPAAPPVSAAGTLHMWAERPLPPTAFHHVYGLTTAAEGSTTGDSGSPLVLDAAQRAAVRAARSSPVTVVSGPPGTGKSQTVVAIALDAVANGMSVLVAAPSDAAVSALVDLLSRSPGPDPVVFGSSARREELAVRLGQGGGPRSDAAEVRRRWQAAADAGVAYGRARRAVAELLGAEQLAAGADDGLVLHARQVAPRLFDADADLTGATVLVDRARKRRRLFGAGRQRRAIERLIRFTGADQRSIDEIAGALETAIRARRASAAEATGGITIGGLWSSLAATEDAYRATFGQWLDSYAHSAERVSKAGRESMSVVATALRSGRAKRRTMLATLPGRALVDALPLWIGTLRDIDDLLPAAAGVFDLAIVDEASQVDQLAAPAVLLRAQRVVVAGDPRQLRHVSFLADDAVSAAIDTHVGRADPLLAGRLDVRRASLFDVAASAAPVHHLTSHYRSTPHLIDFSARRFYGGGLHIANRHPANEATDCIDVIRLNGTRADGVNATEVAAVLAHLQVAAVAGRTSIGVMSPFRDQADALEEALIGALSIEEIDALDLRVGTVHGFQGCERDEIVLSLAIDAEADPGSLRFLHDPNLFNVMVTRARRRLVIVTSIGDRASGLTADLLRHAEAPPARPRPVVPPAGWLAQVASEAAARGIEVVPHYPAGGGSVDLCVGAGSAAFGVECGVHLSGPEAHIDHHLGLLRAGWTLRDAFRTRWQNRLPELIVELANHAPVASLADGAPADQ